MPSESFGTTDADIILRSASRQEFHTHKCVLSLASPVFRNMLTFPQPSSEPLSVPVVDVSETGKVLDVLLRCIYPVPKPIVEDFQLLKGLVAAAEKYEMDVVLDMAKSWLAIPEILRRDPLYVYVVACASSVLHEQAKVAAQWMTFNTIISARWDTVDLLTTIDHHRLIVYLVKRRNEAKRIIEEPWQPKYPVYLCDCETEDWREFKKEISIALLDAFLSNPPLNVDRAVALAFKQLVKVHPCSSNQDCMIVTRAEEYAREVMEKLAEMSDRLAL